MFIWYTWTETRERRTLNPQKRLLIITRNLSLRTQEPEKCVKERPRVKVPACHRLGPPGWLKYSVHTSLSALLPFRLTRRPHAVWCPFSGPGCRGRRSGERRSPTTETLVKTQKLRSKSLVITSPFLVSRFLQFYFTKVLSQEFTF